MLSPLYQSPPEPEADRPALVDERLPAEAGELTGVRQRVERAARSCGLDDRGCFEFVFAVNEAVTNAIRYGGHRGDDRFGLRVDAHNGVITATVTSRGAFLSTAGCPDPWAESGRGFHYMRLLVDDVRVQSNPLGTAVHLRKFTPADRG